MKKNEFNIEIIKKLCNGIVKSVGNNQIITRFCNDTRELQNGDMFISIKMILENYKTEICLFL